VLAAVRLPLVGPFLDRRTVPFPREQLFGHPLRVEAGGANVPRGSFSRTLIHELT